MSEIFGLRGGGIEIIWKIIGVQKCQYLAKWENWTNASAYCSSKLIVSNECLVYIQSLNFPLIINITKIVWFHIS